MGVCPLYIPNYCKQRSRKLAPSLRLLRVNYLMVSRKKIDLAKTSVTTGLKTTRAQAAHAR